MTTKDTDTICHECGTRMRRGKRNVEFAYEGESVTVSQPGWLCENCGEMVVSGEDAKTTDLDFAALCRRMNNSAHA